MQTSFMRRVIGYLYLWMDGERYFLLKAHTESGPPNIPQMYEALDCGHIQPLRLGWHGKFIGWADRRKCKQCVRAQPIYLRPQDLADLPKPPQELRRLA